MNAGAVGKNYSEVKLAYASGFIDADGAIMACIEKHSEKKFGFRVRVVLKVSQKEIFIIKWFLKTFGPYGTILFVEYSSSLPRPGS